jgi:hypothetical protein
MRIKDNLLDEICRESHNSITSWHVYDHYSIQGNFIFVYYNFMGFKEDLTMKMVPLSKYIEMNRDHQLDKLI